MSVVGVAVGNSQSDESLTRMLTTNDTASMRSFTSSSNAASSSCRVQQQLGTKVGVQSQVLCTRRVSSRLVSEVVAIAISRWLELIKLYQLIAVFGVLKFLGTTVLYV